MSNRRGTKSISVYWMGNKNYSCPKIGATKIFCVLDKGYNSIQDDPNSDYLKLSHCDLPFRMTQILIT